MATPIENYRQAVTTAREAKNAGYTQIDADLPYNWTAPLEERRTVNAARFAREEVLDAAQSQAYQDADAALKAAYSDDRLIGWIIDNALDDYYDEAVVAIEALTHAGNANRTPLEILEEKASDEGWCNVWTTMRTQMIADGVVTNNRAEARAELMRVLQHSNFNGDGPDESEAKALVERHDQEVTARVVLSDRAFLATQGITLQEG